MSKISNPQQHSLNHSAIPTLPMSDLVGGEGSMVVHMASCGRGGKYGRAHGIVWEGREVWSCTWHRVGGEGSMVVHMASCGRGGKYGRAHGIVWEGREVWSCTWHRVGGEGSMVVHMASH